jgi:hypothetical protein
MTKDNFLEVVRFRMAERYRFAAAELFRFGAINAGRNSRSIRPDTFAQDRPCPS